MKKDIVLIVIIVAVLCIGVINTVNAVEMRTFVGKDYTIDLPADWGHRHGGYSKYEIWDAFGEDVYTPRADVGPYVMIFRWDMTKHSPQYADVSSLDKLADVKLSMSQDEGLAVNTHWTIINGEKVWVMEGCGVYSDFYDLSVDEVHQYNLQLSETVYYTITCQSRKKDFDEYNRVYFEPMVQSFKFKDKPQEQTPEPTATPTPTPTIKPTPTPEVSPAPTPTIPPSLKSSKHRAELYKCLARSWRDPIYEKVLNKWIIEPLFTAVIKVSVEQLIPPNTASLSIKLIDEVRYDYQQLIDKRKGFWFFKMPSQEECRRLDAMIEDFNSKLDIPNSCDEAFGQSSSLSPWKTGGTLEHGHNPISYNLGLMHILTKEEALYRGEGSILDSIGYKIFPDHEKANAVLKEEKKYVSELQKILEIMERIEGKAETKEYQMLIQVTKAFLEEENHYLQNI